MLQTTLLLSTLSKLPSFFTLWRSALFCQTCNVKFNIKMKKHGNQECIPVGCVPPVHRLYLPGPGGCTWSRGGEGVPGPRGVYLVWGGTWSGGVYLVFGRCTWSRGGVPGPRGVYLVPEGCTWSREGGTWSGTPPL